MRPVERQKLFGYSPAVVAAEAAAVVVLAEEEAVADPVAEMPATAAEI